jgi:hypothetical protein
MTTIPNRGSITIASYSTTVLIVLSLNYLVSIPEDNLLILTSLPRWAYAVDPSLIRRGGAPSGAAEPLARGGMGATAPILWIRFQSPATRTATRTFIRKLRVASGQFRKMIDPRAEDLQKSLTRLSNFLKKVRQGYRTFQKLSGKVIELLKIVHQSYRTFLKLSGKVIGLFKNSSPELPDFSKIIRQRYRSFWKKCGPKTHLPTSDPPSDFTGLSKNTRQGYRTFQKMPGKVIGLFKNRSSKLPAFSKIARDSHRTF